MGEIGTAFGGVPAPDPLAQFLGRVLAWSTTDPPDAYVNIHGFTPKEHVAARQFPRKGGGRAYASMLEYPQLQQFLWMLDRDGDEVFFCISTRSAHKGVDKQGNKKATRAKALNRPVRLKAFVLDLDVKPKGYPSQRAALAAALPFFDRLGIKPLIVDTGVGLHAYITLDQPITPDRWQPLANALIEAARQGGLKFDVAVTRDDDRILRLPTSFNRKDPANPKICRLLTLGADTSLVHLEQILAPYSGISRSVNEAPRANGHAPKVDLSFLPPRPPITRGPDVDRVRAERDRLRVVTSVDLVAEACPVVQDSEWRGGNGDREPLWFELAKLCHYIEDGREFFHKLSKNDPRYDEDQTNEKFDQAEPQGWPACATIAAASGDAEHICRTCPHYGEGKSPINFATRGDPPGEASSGQVNGHVNGHALSAAFTTASSITVRPEWLPEKYRYENNYVLTPEGQPCFHTPILNIRPRYEHDGTGDTMVIEFTTLKGTKDVDDTNTFSLSASVLATRTEAAKAMGKYGLFPNPLQKDHDFMTDTLTLVREKRLAVTRERTGWNTDVTEFPYGGHVYTADGPRPGAAPSSPYLMPRGSFDSWKAAANAMLGKGLVELEVIMATGYTGSLVPFSGVPGVFLYAWSGPSGRGKSAACAAACSVSCDPRAIIKDNTDKSGLKRIVSFNNIPVYFDELVPDNADHARTMAQVIKSVTSGSDRLRLQRTGAAEQETLHSRNQVVGCGNKSIIEAARVSETNAQAARVIEYEVPDKLEAAGFTQEMMLPIAEALEQNYGMAMPVYIDHVVRHREQIKQAIHLTIQSLRMHLKAGPPTRFWLAQMAVIIVAAKLARMLGLQQFDIPGIQKFLIDWYHRNYADAFGAEQNSDDVEFQMRRIRDFYNDNLRARLITDYLPRRGQHKEQAKNMDMMTSPDQLAIRIGLVDKKMLMSVKKCRDYCDRREQRGASFEHTKRVLVRNNVCTYERKGKSIGGSTIYYTAQEPFLEFVLNDPRNAGFIEEV
jgi:hypothetical protein